MEYALREFEERYMGKWACVLILVYMEYALRDTIRRIKDRQIES